METRGASNHLTVFRTNPHNEAGSKPQNIKSAEVEETRSRSCAGISQEAPGTRQIPSPPDRFILSYLFLVILKIITSKKPIKALPLVANGISWKPHRCDPPRHKCSLCVLSSCSSHLPLPVLPQGSGAGQVHSSSSSVSAVHPWGRCLHRERMVQKHF